MSVEIGCFSLLSVISFEESAVPQIYQTEMVQLLTEYNIGGLLMRLLAEDKPLPSTLHQLIVCCLCDVFNYCPLLDVDMRVVRCLRVYLEDCEIPSLTLNVIRLFGNMANSAVCCPTLCEQFDVVALVLNTMVTFGKQSRLDCVQSLLLLLCNVTTHDFTAVKRLLEAPGRLDRLCSLFSEPWLPPKGISSLVVILVNVCRHPLFTESMLPSVVPNLLQSLHTSTAHCVYACVCLCSRFPESMVHLRDLAVSCHAASANGAHKLYLASILEIEQ
jgi:hypothetical protein